MTIALPSVGSRLNNGGTCLGYYVEGVQAGFSVWCVSFHPRNKSEPFRVSKVSAAPALDGGYRLQNGWGVSYLHSVNNVLDMRVGSSWRVYDLGQMDDFGMSLEIPRNFD